MSYKKLSRKHNKHTRPRGKKWGEDGLRQVDFGMQRTRTSRRQFKTTKVRHR